MCVEARKRRIGLGSALGVLAIVFVAGAIWAATALAADGSGSSTGSSDTPAASSAETQREAPSEDCPARSDSDENSSA
jgi:hypothetical protein